MNIKQQTIELIDKLKATCQTYGLGNDGNEYKIITQVFLYKFLNDKFGHEIKKISREIGNSSKWEESYSKLSEDERNKIFNRLSPDVPRLMPEHLISFLWNKQDIGDFDLLFDKTMVNIAETNIDIFSTQTSENTKIPLFEKITNYVTDDTKRSAFAKALIDKLVNFSFEDAFCEHYDFFATIFEYLIKDYNTAGGGKYAEYYTPHSIATIMAKLLVGDRKDLHNIECYDPSAGTGTLLMALAHQIGEEKCTIFAQDISQRSNKMLKLNLILNGLVSSLDHAIQGDTLLHPYHKTDDGLDMRKFDFIVSNPPFKCDFSETREQLSSMPKRFWAGVPKIPPKDKSSMAIYTCFIQHVINSLAEGGKAAIVVPTGFLTHSKGVEGAIIKRILSDKILYGVISMPSNVFATTQTNVSILFFSKEKKYNNVILIDASKMGEDYTEGTIKKKRLTKTEIDEIVNTFFNRKEKDKFSVLVDYKKLLERLSLFPGQYFDLKIEVPEINSNEFNSLITSSLNEINDLSEKNNTILNEINDVIKRLKYGNN